MNTKLEQKIIEAKRNGLTDEQLEEFLAKHKPKAGDLSNPYFSARRTSGEGLFVIFNFSEQLAFQERVLAAQIKLREALDKERGDWRPDWDNSAQRKWAFWYARDNNKAYANFSRSVQHSADWNYLPSQEAWERVINEVGEDVVKLALFEIER